MSFAEALGGGKPCLVAEVDPPKGTSLTGFVDASLALKGRVDAMLVTDGSHAVMRMTPLAPCRALIERNIETVMALNGRDRNRIAFQGDLLAAWSLGLRTVLLREGQNPAVGDQPLARSSGDLDIEVMARCVAALNSGTDLSKEPLDGATGFTTGVHVDLSDDPAMNRRSAERLGILAEAGIDFAVLGPTYDMRLVDGFVEPARRAGIRLLGSVMLLKSVAMIRFLNRIDGMPAIPEECLEKMMQSPVKSQAGMEMAADLVRNLGERCRGAVILAIGWGGRLSEFLDILDRAGRDGIRV